MLNLSKKQKIVEEKVKAEEDLHLHLLALGQKLNLDFRRIKETLKNKYYNTY